ncbi:MAG: hypothetical protein A3K09_00865 [Nitrospinae bacterium RIFCSPLOWO2_12_FULL_47_7]|nr:MAG: hypothetical protein A3K09_00865 [Nitrospinae bacterium RIFCSPLOWO2_12_FULL_47_7]
MASVPLDGFKGLDSLPSLPSQMLNVLEELGRTSAMDYNIVQIIQYDASIACQVLKVANSPLYGYQGEIASLQQASGLLGPGVIKNSILTTPVLELFSENSLRKIDYNRIWLHSAVTGAIAGCLGKFVRDMESDVCFTAGLIHDIGKIALAVHHSSVFRDVLDLVEKEKISLVEAEQKILGFCHSDIASAISAQWGLPSALVKALGNCSRPIFVKTSDKLSALIQLAKFLAVAWGYPDGMESHFPCQYDDVISVLGISKEKLDIWKPEMVEYADYVVHKVLKK